MTRIATSSASVLGCGLKRGIVRFHVDSPQGYLELGLLKGMAVFDCNARIQTWDLPSPSKLCKVLYLHVVSRTGFYQIIYILFQVRNTVFTRMWIDIVLD